MAFLDIDHYDAISDMVDKLEDMQRDFGKTEGTIAFEAEALVEEARKALDSILNAPSEDYVNSDGSINEEAIGHDVHDGVLAIVSELPDEPGRTEEGLLVSYLLVSDHGNRSLFVFDESEGRWREVW